MQICHRAQCTAAALVAALMLQVARVSAMDLSTAAEPAASDSTQVHFVWALLLTALAVAFAAIGFRYGEALQNPAWLVIQYPF